MPIKMSFYQSSGKITKERVEFSTCYFALEDEREVRCLELGLDPWDVEEEEEDWCTPYRIYHFKLSAGDGKIFLSARYSGKWTINRKNILGDSIEWITTENGCDVLRIILPNCDEEVTVQRTSVG